MRLAHFDCFSGAAGDMIVGALLDAGLEIESLRAGLASLKLPDCTISAEKVRRGELVGTKFTVAAAEADQPHRGLDDILSLIRGADLPGRAGEIAEAIFRRLADAEAKVHGIDAGQVHFHEIGAIDSIMDIVAAAVGIELLGIEKVTCSPIVTGRGTVETQHGTLPVPAPATAELLKGALILEPEDRQQPRELTTPTGAAVLTTLAAAYGPMPAMELQAVGFGAGSHDGGPLPNLLRVFIGSEAEEGSADSMVELSANLDDCTGEVLGATIAKLLSAGCADAWAAPIYMKKSRPAWMLSALCSPADAGQAEQIIFAETTTLGIRRRTCRRSKLARRHVTVETPYGPIRVKVGYRKKGTDNFSDGECKPSQNAATAPNSSSRRDEARKVVSPLFLTVSPEFADCLAAAEAHGAPVKEVIAAAVEAYHKRRGSRTGD